MNAAFSITGTIGVCFGSAIAAIADRFPAQRDKLQHCGGAFFIGGVTLIAIAAPII